MSNSAGHITVKVEGLREVMEKLENLGPKFARRALRKALRAVGDYWIPEVQSRAPNLDGDLKNSIIKRVVTRKRGNDLSGTVVVGPNLYAPRTDGKKSVGPGIYGMWLEFGLKTRDYPAHPFMRPTFDTTVQRAIDLFAERLKAELPDAVK